MTAALALTSGAALADAVRRAERLASGPLESRPPLPVDPALTPLLPHGLLRGSTLHVGAGGGVASTSLTLALLGAASTAGSWCALVGLPALTAEALTGFGLDLDRLAVVPAAPAGRPTLPRSSWTTAVGALVDAVDVVVVRPPGRLPDGDVRRLTARARSRGAVLVVVTPGGGVWPGADVRLGAEHVRWDGVEHVAGYGRLRARQVSVSVAGRGRHGSGRPAQLWLPSRTGGVAAVEPADTVTPLRRVG